MKHFQAKVLLKGILHRKIFTNKNSKGEIRTLDLAGMSRALSPTELPCHISMIIQLSAVQTVEILSVYNSHTNIFKYQAFWFYKQKGLVKILLPALLHLK